MSNATQVTLLLRWLWPLAANYALLIGLWLLAKRVPGFSAPWLAAAVVVLALPGLLSLLHRNAVTRVKSLHQLVPDRWPYRWASYRLLGTLMAVVVGFAVAAGVVLASPLFGGADWAILFVAPIVWLGVRMAAARWLAPYFTRHVYSADVAARIARWITVVALGAAWIAWRLHAAEAPAAPLGETVYELQSAWSDVPSAIVRDSLDVGAWGQAIVAIMGRWSDAPLWKIALAAVLVPTTVLGYVVFAFSGLGLSAGEIRRTFARHLTAADVPPPVDVPQTAIVAATATVGLVVVLAGFVQLESVLQGQGRLFAVAPIPKCERIGATAYRLQTVETLQRYLAHFERQIAAQAQTGCSRLNEVERLAAVQVDQYLDWYFSLGAEWLRLAHLLAGNVENLLSDKFAQMVLAAPGVGPQLLAAQDDYDKMLGQVAVSRNQMLDLLDQNRLVLSESQCHAVTVIAANPWTPRIDSVRTRLVSASGAGLAVGVLSGRIAARAMTKTSMRAAGKVIARLAAKKAISQGTASAAGMALGSVAPGVGNATGAAVGLAVGTAIGLSVDMAMLAAEEHFTRDQMKADLLAAVAETLRPYRETFGCAGR